MLKLLCTQSRLFRRPGLRILLTCTLGYALLVLLPFSAASQTVRGRVNKCGAGYSLSEVLAHPVQSALYRAGKARVAAEMARMRSTLNYDMNRVYRIPVVFHIVDPNPQRITDAMIRYQLDVMNRDFAGINADSTNAAGFYNVRGHVKFVFELAKRSPEGCDTNGIVRKVSNAVFTSPTINRIKYNATGGSDAWDAYHSKYLNIWVGTVSDDLLGKATFPFADMPPQEQGVFVGIKTFQNNPALGSYTYGRTLVHEVGHYFGLFHIWDEPGCASDDEIRDTPLQDDASSGRPVAPVYDLCSPAATVTGINFQNFMDYCDDTVLTMFTRLQDSVMVASLYVYDNRRFLISPKNKALEPKEQNQLFTQCNTAAFTTNSFTSIGVGKNGVVWAGTANSGLYKYSDSIWQRYSLYSNNLYQDIKADKDGGIWIAQSGYNGAQAITGGILYFPDTSFANPANFYSASSGLPSRYPRSLFIDTTRLSSAGAPLVWSAHFAQITAGVSANGGVGRGFSPTAPNFISLRDGLEPADITGGTAACYVVGGNAIEIWTATQNNYARSQILRFDAVTNAALPAYDTTNVFNGMLNSNFNTRAIYFDAIGRKWLTVQNEGIIIQDSSGTWHKVKFPALFPAGTPTFNNSAIAGDAEGNVYMGTPNGLVVYQSRGRITLDSSYRLYTTAQGLPSNNIRAVAVDTLRKKLLIATDNGIVFWNPTCANGPIVDTTVFSTSSTGDWNNPAIWCNGVVPPPNARIIVRHPVTITTNTRCLSLELVQPGTFTVATGVDFSVGP